ncbi:MAG: radical SAM family heme chaperone HemW [Bacteroidales bacterium]|nr:radical SAM family heme chaperone HemW [Bacteroidales bacterium]
MSGIYIHIPFCRQKCYYCNFYSINNLHQKDTLETALIAELSLRQSFLQDSIVETIYFGGGTPTLMGISSLEKILDAIYRRFRVSNQPEITIETNPDDLTLSFSNDLLHLCNRLSIGIQSFNDDELRYLGRQHNAETAIQAISNCRTAGFNNISLDLIYGINNDLISFQKSVATALRFHPEHLSAYALTCEPNTVFSRLIAQKKRSSASDEAVAEQYQYLTEQLKNNGYQHYEISNFSKPDFTSKHNSNYWNGTPYLGIGPSAHSFSGDVREWNSASVTQYVQDLHNGFRPFEQEQLTEVMQFEEMVMLRLRTAQGVDIAEMAEKFGETMAKQWIKKAQKYLSTGDITEHNGCYRIAEKSFLISDAIIVDLV